MRQAAAGWDRGEAIRSPWHQLADIFNEAAEVSLNGVPNDPIIDTIVSMNQDVAERDDIIVEMCQGFTLHITEPFREAPGP